MKRFILLLALVAPLVFAQVPRTVTIQHATERVDGSALSLAEIDRVDVRCYVAGTQTEITALAIVPPNTSAETLPAFTEGDYICHAWTVDTLAQTSPDFSASPVFTVGHPCQELPSPETCAAPMPPQSIIIALDPQ